MGLFKKKNKDENNGALESASNNTSQAGNDRRKRDSKLNDPVLSAVTQEQPFQNMGHRATSSVSNINPNLRDVFGNHIPTADYNNPTRARNERPLDTIRAFEYSCTGDERVRDEIETPKLGWQVRENFYSYTSFDSNPYAYARRGEEVQQAINVGDYEQYSKPMSAPAAEKKKRGLFGKKKKEAIAE